MPLTLFQSNLLSERTWPAVKAVALGMTFVLTLSACTQITPVAQKRKKLIPKVGELIPSAGSTSGGTTLSIIGAGFVTGSTVSIGSQSCLEITIVSATEIRCVTPPHMPEGVLAVVITHPSGGAYRVPSGFRTFDTLPAVAGRVIASQGGFMTGTDGSGAVQMKMHLTLGEPVASGLQSGTDLKARLGIQGVLYDQ